MNKEGHCKLTLVYVIDFSSWESYIMSFRNAAGCETVMGNI